MESKKRNSKTKSVEKPSKNTKKSNIADEIITKIDNKPKVSKNLPTTTNGDSNTNDHGSWATHESVLVKDFGSLPSKLIIAFDLDDTLIQPKSGKAFAQNQNDWKLLFNNIKDKINEYQNKDYKIVIISNQAGITSGQTNQKDWTNKVDAIQQELDVPLLVLAALEKDYYRKPSIGMWNLLIEKFNGNIHPNDVEVSSCIYVGDAAGRPKNGKRKKDHSDSDYKFAVNVGMQFFTPEHFFQNQKETLPKFEFDPKIFKQNTKLFENAENSALISEKQEMILFVGSPASGKTTMYRNHLEPKGYIHVNNDTLKNAAKCLAVAEKAISEGKSVVIDNTSPGAATRKNYIDLAKKHDIPVRCYYFHYPKEWVFHFNKVRASNIGRTHNSPPVKDMVIHFWYKNLEVPQLTEGFSDILKVNFVPGPFVNDLDEKLFYLFSS